ncbi:hypothetical protein [Nostoc sp. MG11]|nr:hypothetical protein [Nostoc sp. MG11]
MFRNATKYSTCTLAIAPGVLEAIASIVVKNKSVNKIESCQVCTR